MQAVSPVLVVDRFPELLDELLDLLKGLAGAEWERPTVAAGWTVKDIALHLLGDEISILSGKRDGFSEPGVTIVSWDELVSWINQRNELWVKAARRISPQLLCDLLRFAGDQANAYFRTLDLDAPGGPVSWAGPQPAPVWLDLAREFTERWHHQQHIRHAVGKPGLTGPDYLGPVLATFVWALPVTYQDIEAPAGTQISLTITGEAGGAWTVVREARSWQLYQGKPDDSQAEVILPAEVAWRLFTRGLSKEEARASASLLGDPRLAEKLLDTVSIIA